MVARVYGTVNGNKTVFSNTGGNCWEVAIPANGNGECVVEIWAEDDAGNVSYMATMLFTTYGHQMRCYIVPRGYSGESNCQEYKVEVDLNEVLAQILNGTYTAEQEERRYFAEVTGRRYGVELELCRENRI